jgi:RNA polymerase sigma-70 factor (sigma-E family)
MTFRDGWAAPKSFEDFVRGRHVALLRFAHLLCGDAHLANDLVQEALVRAGLAWQRIERQESPEAYVRKTIVNLNLNRRRKLWRERLVDTFPERAHVDSPGQPDESLWAALLSLPKAQRTVLVLRFYEDMSESEIAAVLGCSAGTVKSNSSRAMAKLRDQLRARGDESVGKAVADKRPSNGRPGDDLLVVES